jgi:Zn-dependent alcohol dehydrogenase
VVALRSTNLRVMGSGQGSVAAKAVVAELPRLVDEIVRGRIPVDVIRVPLAEVERAWNAPVPAGRRVVMVP